MRSPTDPCSTIARCRVLHAANLYVYQPYAPPQWTCRAREANPGMNRGVISRAQGCEARAAVVCCDGESTTAYPPAIAPTTRNGSAPLAILLGSGASGNS